MTAASFQFTDERPQPAEATLVVRIPAGLNRKRRVLAEYAGPLRFPNYFGWNWDAFEECLRDLSWLDGVRKVIIVHRDVPFAKAPEQRAIYLSILRERCAANGIAVEVHFPCSAEAMVLGAPAD